MSSRKWRFRIEDILDALSRLDRYVAGMDFDAFRLDEKTVDAVVRNLEIIGEAAGHVPPVVQRQHAEIPWKKMKAFRNVLAHRYFDVSLPIIWQALREDLPPLRPLLKVLLAEAADSDLLP